MAQFVNGEGAASVRTKINASIAKTDLISITSPVDLNALATGGGTQGPQGDPGPKGDPGERGLPGADGADGADGTNGTNGADGADGTNGTDGTNAIITVVATEAAFNAATPAANELVVLYA